MAGPPSAAYQVRSECPLAGALADKLRESKADLVLHWLTRISERMSIHPNRVFPTDDLLDHVPILIDGIAAYLEDPAAVVGTDTPVVGKAMELGRLRYTQGFDAHEILKEYEILGGILFTYLAHASDQMTEPCEKSELLVCGHRLFSAIAVIQAATTTQYLRLADERVAEREARLRAFNHTISHEIKNQVGAILGAGEILETITDLSDDKRSEFQQLILRRARAMKDTLENLLSLGRTEQDARQHRHITLVQAVKEARRGVREAAQDAGVKVHLDPNIPDVEVNAAVVELSLTNYLTNTIKYANTDRADRRVDISATIEQGEAGTEIVVRVHDNGLGVPDDKRARLFERFYRAHETISGAEGTGLGLSIVRDTVESIGGRAWAEFPERGSVFAFALPARREPRSDRRESEPPTLASP